MAASGAIEMVLYVAGDLPNSRRAVANLRAFCRDEMPGEPQFEILDVLENPERALRDRVLITPQLTVSVDGETRALSGDLSDRDALRQFFRVEPP